MSSTPAQTRARLIFDACELQYDFGHDHPFQARRLAALIDLLESSGLWHSGDERHSLPFRPASIEELSLIHLPEYISAVQQLSMPEENLGDPQEEQAKRAQLAREYGFAEGDTPAIAGMHEVAARIAGGTLVALSTVMGLDEGETGAPEERPLHIFHPAGGLHHAWAERASGFCIYNDIAVAIAHVLRSSEAKVLYIDFDAHHGDGVQRAFYDEPRVMTISLHETGRYLFPGTGDVLELGNGLGRGYSVNLPLAPFTEDDSYIEVMNALLPPLVMSFAPDVIISQHGCDTHAWDPLTHLELTTRSIQAQVRCAHRLAHTYCHGRWVALGGGGYDQFRVVPRVWSMLWAEMSGQALPVQLPEQWIERWRPAWEAVKEQEVLEQELAGKTSFFADFPTTFEDQADHFPPQPRRWSISLENRRTAAMLRQILVPSPIRKVFAAAQRQSPLTDLYDLLHPGGAHAEQSEVFETPKESILLRNFCPPSLVERLTVDSGLHAFARLPEREHQLLVDIARSPDCALTLAHTSAGAIVGEVTLTFGDDWWEGLEDIYEVTIEVSSNWRKLGIARKLLAFALELETLDDMILFAMGLSWHWDLEGMGITPRRYREMIRQLFSSQGFTEYATTEPNINLEPANILLVRIGKRVDQYVANRFLRRISSSPHLTGL